MSQTFYHTHSLKGWVCFVTRLVCVFRVRPCQHTVKCLVDCFHMEVEAIAAGQKSLHKFFFLHSLRLLSSKIGGEIKKIKKIDTEMQKEQCYFTVV